MPTENDSIYYLDGIAPLFAAIQCRRYNAVKALLLHAGKSQVSLINTPLTNGITPLYMSVCLGFLALVDLLLAYGANPNLAYVENDNATPLSIAANNGYDQVVSMLLAKRANPLLATLNEGNTTLFIASHNGHTSVVKLLLTK